MPPDELARQRFGKQLREIREQSGLTQVLLARKVSIATSSLSDVERGKYSPSPQLIARLDESVGNGRLGRMWAELTGSGRPPWLEEVTDLILQAESVHDYQALVFPGYLQTEAYAEAIYRHGAPWLTPDAVASKIEDRVNIGKRVAQATTPLLIAVVDETVLWRRYGSPAVMREQLTHVADLIGRNRLTLHIMPARNTVHPGVSGSFIVISSDPTVVYAESVHEGQVITTRSDVARYRMLYGKLQGESLNPRDSLALLRQEIEGIHDR